jgi:uncharacterized membrane protein YtjA (UPF0391 family)
MLKWAIVFAAIAILAAMVGFSGAAAGATGIAKLLFIVCLVVAAVTMMRALLAGDAAARRSTQRPRPARVRDMPPIC